MSDLVYEFNIESKKEKGFGGANAAIENLIRHQLMDLLNLINYKLHGLVGSKEFNSFESFELNTVGPKLVSFESLIS